MTRAAEPGEVVTAGTAIVTLLDMSKVYLRGFVPEGQIGKVKIGQPARVYLDSAPDKPIDAVRAAHRSAGHVHAREHLLPRRPRETGGRRQAAAQRSAPDSPNPACRPTARFSSRATSGPRAVSTNDSRRFHRRNGRRSRRRGRTAPRFGFAISGSATACSMPSAVSISKSRDGEIFGLIGPDGAGKTTTFQILAGVMEATSGTAEVFGVPAREARSHTGYLTQAFSLYPDLTVAENIRYIGDLRRVPPDEITKRGRRYLRMFDMDRFEHRLAARLSGGMKQKLALACALVPEPRVLLLDEPTTGVDPVSRREFWDTLAHLAADGLTIVLATPYLDEAERCNRVALMHQGEIRQTGTPGRTARQPACHAAWKFTLRIWAVAERVLSAIAGPDKEIIDVQRFGDRLDLLAHKPEEAKRVADQALERRGARDRRRSHRRTDARKHLRRHPAEPRTNGSRRAVSRTPRSPRACAARLPSARRISRRHSARSRR